jgi:F-type H+-transporting ATPase subunit b
MGMELLSPAYGTIFWTTITFLLLMFILKKMAWKPILTALDEREKKIREALEKADLARKETEEALAKNQGILDQAKREAQEILSKSRKTAEATKQEIVEKAEEEAAHLVEKARKEIGLERDKAIEELKKQTTDLSIQIASKLIRRSLSAEDHKDLISESLDRFSETS